MMKKMRRLQVHMLTKVKVITKKLNISCWLAEHLIGKKHSTFHRILIGLILIAIGMLIGARLEVLTSFYEKLPVKFVEVLLEALGAIPIADYFLIHSEKTV